MNEDMTTVLLHDSRRSLNDAIIIHQHTLQRTDRVHKTDHQDKTSCDPGLAKRDAIILTSLFVVFNIWLLYRSTWSLVNTVDIKGLWSDSSLLYCVGIITMAEILIIDTENLLLGAFIMKHDESERVKYANERLLEKVEMFPVYEDAGTQTPDVHNQIRRHIDRARERTANVRLNIRRRIRQLKSSTTQKVIAMHRPSLPKLHPHLAPVGIDRALNSLTTKFPENYTVRTLKAELKHRSSALLSLQLQIPQIERDRENMENEWKEVLMSIEDEKHRTEEIDERARLLQEHMKVLKAVARVRTQTDGH